MQFAYYLSYRLLSIRVGTVEAESIKLAAAKAALRQMTPEQREQVVKCAIVACEALEASLPLAAS